MGAPAVVVIGSINVDFIVSVSRLPRPGETVTQGIMERQGGGKSANQALAAARGGATTTLIAAVGDDDLGPEALRALQAAGVDVSRCLRLAGTPTAVALIAVDPAGENQIVVASGANGRLDGSMVESALADLVPAPGAVCLLGFEVGDDAVIAGARWASANRLSIVLNPAPARRVPDELLAMSLVLTPNRSEVWELTGIDDPILAAQRLAEETGWRVIVTLGADGVAVVAGPLAPVQRLPAFRVEAVDTTGAGDAFNGVLAAGLAAGLGLYDAVDRAMAAAALSTTKPGAQAGLPHRAEIDALLEPRVDP